MPTDFSALTAQIDEQFNAAEKVVADLTDQLSAAQNTLNRLQAARDILSGKKTPVAPEGSTRRRTISLSPSGSALRTAKIKYSRLMKAKPKNPDAIKAQAEVVAQLQAAYDKSQEKATA